MEEFKFAYDSLLEGVGFEPSVPQCLASPRAPLPPVAPPDLA
jgi:hypothetical protein